MRILGIDPGTRSTGYGMVERIGARSRHVQHGTLRAPRDLPLALRLASIAEALRQLLRAERPDVAVVERVFLAASPRSALVLSHVRGVALAAAGEAGVPVVEYAAGEIKQAVAGNGGATKLQVQRMVQRLLALPAAPATDAADALAAALCHAHTGPLAGLARTRRRTTRSRAPGWVVRRAR